MTTNITGLYLFQGYSLVDITATGVIRGYDSNEISRNQQCNWETVIQCMGLRTQPQHIRGPVKVVGEADQFEFGNLYTGNQTVWTWRWAVEQSGVYDSNLAFLGGLLQDFEQVPIVCGLEETARFMLPIFYPYGSIKNIYFKQYIFE